MSSSMVCVCVCVETELPVSKKRHFPWHCTHILSITDTFVPVNLLEEQSLAVLTAVITDYLKNTVTYSLKVVHCRQ
jgi:hypothetical protein